MLKQLLGRELQRGMCYMLGGQVWGKKAERKAQFWFHLQFSLRVLLTSSYRKGPLLTCLALSCWVHGLRAGMQCCQGAVLLAWNCTQLCICRNPCKHIHGELWAPSPCPHHPAGVLSWLWPAVTCSWAISLPLDSIIFPNGRAEGFAAWGWLGVVHGLRLGWQLPRQALSHGHIKGWLKSPGSLQKQDFTPFA